MAADHRPERDPERVPQPRAGGRRGRSWPGSTRRASPSIPEAQALTAVRRDELLAGVRALPAELREVVACRYLLELTEAETATALQLPAGTVKSRLHRALSDLAEGGDRCLRSPIVLIAELQALGRTMVVEPPAEDLVERVLARLPAEPRRSRTRSWLRAPPPAPGRGDHRPGDHRSRPDPAGARRRGRVAADRRRADPDRARPPPGPPRRPSPRRRRVPRSPWMQAQALVAFPIGVPAELGPPDRIEVSADRRVVSMDWTSGSVPIHLDQFDGVAVLDLRQEGAAAPFEVTAVGGRDAVWFPTAARGQLCRPRRQRTDRAGPDRRPVPGLGAPGGTTRTCGR